MKPIELHPAAGAEIIAAMDHYERKEALLGDDFMEKTQRTFSDIVFMPGLGVPIGPDGDRWRRLERFPYVVYYREYDDVIYVFAVAHKSQQLGYWTNRYRP